MKFFGFLMCWPALLLYLSILLSIVLGQENGVNKDPLLVQPPPPPPDIDERILGGTPAEKERYPYIVSLRNEGIQTHACGGVLIHPDWVATAAHCVDTMRGFTNALPSPVLVYIGGLARDEFLEERLTKPEPHPDWDGDISRGYDFALLQLNESSTIQFIQPIDEDFELTTDCFFSAMGWGRLSERGPFAPVLQVAKEMPYYPPDLCSNSFERSVDKLLCAGDGSSDNCAGDQGGPLIKSSPNNNPAEDLLVGIATAATSFRSATCSQPGVPGVYVNMKLVLPWVKSMLESN